ncbi:hypothetical protein JCM14469_12700 [Desulfatiferula olefinivorans]
MNVNDSKTIGALPFQCAAPSIRSDHGFKYSNDQAKHYTIRCAMPTLFSDPPPDPLIDEPFQAYGIGYIVMFQDVLSVVTDSCTINCLDLSFQKL